MSTKSTLTTLAAFGAGIILAVTTAACLPDAPADSTPSPSPVVTDSPAPGTNWNGFIVGEVLVCPDGIIESDQYPAGQDPAMPNGGTWGHCA